MNPVDAAIAAHPFLPTLFDAIPAVTDGTLLRAVCETDAMLIVGFSVAPAKLPERWAQREAHMALVELWVEFDGPWRMTYGAGSSDEPGVAGADEVTVLRWPGWRLTGRIRGVSVGGVHPSRWDRQDDALRHPTYQWHALGRL